jgi:DNA repair exonuclease SbcCD nuclease subunit
MSNPVAVLISDVHYSIPTLELADAAVRQAIAAANDLEVALIVAGDLHDTKANMRGECIKAMIATFELADRKPIVLVGNHDRINERSSEHSLEFLKPWADVVDRNTATGFIGSKRLFLFPYYHDLDALRANLKAVKKGSIVIMHQGVNSATSEGYPHDKSAIDENAVAGLRVISGHYHRRQDIVLPDDGLWSYIGNPYTLNYGEAKEPEKGYRILMDDGTLEFVPTNLRKHVVIDLTIDGDGDWRDANNTEMVAGDLIWLKVRGPAKQINKFTKKQYAFELSLPTESFRLDLIPDTVEATAEQEQVDTLSQPELLDEMINSLNVDIQDKERLKTLWKGLSK